MPINFTVIFRDSLNFVRNKPKFLLNFSLLFAAEILVMNFLFGQINPDFAAGLNLKPDEFNFPSSVLGLALMSLLLNIILYAFTMLRIHQISYQKTTNWQAIFYIFSKKILALILTMLIVTFPLLMGAINLIMASLQGSASLTSLLLSIVGLFIFIRLNLTFVDCLVTADSFVNSFKRVWIIGARQNKNLIIFFLINYLFFPFISNNIAHIFVNNSLLAPIFIWLSSVIYVFSLVFTYRFYTCFMQVNSASSIENR